MAAPGPAASPLRLLDALRPALPAPAGADPANGAHDAGLQNTPANVPAAPAQAAVARTLPQRLMSSSPVARRQPA